MSAIAFSCRCRTRSTRTAGAAAGAVLGLVRGLSYLPTLPVAIVEGGILFGVPASASGLLLGGVWSKASANAPPRRLTRLLDVWSRLDEGPRAGDYEGHAQVRGDVEHGGAGLA